MQMCVDSAAVLCLSVNHHCILCRTAKPMGAVDRTCLLRLPLASVTNEPPFCMNKSTYESILPAVVGPNDPEAMPVGVFAGPVKRKNLGRRAYDALAGWAVAAGRARRDTARRLQ